MKNILVALAFFFAFQANSFSADVTALWPTAGQYPAYSRTASFSCDVNISSGDQRWMFSYKQVTGKQGIPPHNGGTYYGWDPGGGDPSKVIECYKFVDKPYCPEGYEWDGAELCKRKDPCSEKAGYYDNAGNPQIVQLSGPQGVYTGNAVDGKVPAEICLSGCSADPRAGYEYVGAVLKDGSYSVQGNPKYTGLSCGDRLRTPDFNYIAKSSPEYNCLTSGQNYGTVNGVVVCTGKTEPKEANGKTTVNTTANADGSKLETKTSSSISCTGAGSCVTTTTTTTTVINADGSRGASTTRTDQLVTQGMAGAGTNGTPQVDKSDPFCVTNPTSPMCKAGAFTGNCTSEPMCDGDPIQCATARAVHRIECKTPELGDPSTLPNGGTGDAIAEKKYDQPFSYTSLGSGGNCGSGMTFHAAGSSVTLDMTGFCAFLGYIRPIVILCAWMAAGFIVVGGIKNA